MSTPGVTLRGDALGIKQVYPGRYEPAGLIGLIQKEQVTFSHCVATIMFMLLGSPAMERRTCRAGR